MALTVLLIAVNVLSYAMYRADKRMAVKHQHRIPESALLIIALAGGALGALLAMCTLRHKTRHVRFVILVPLFLVVQVYLFYLLFVGWSL